MRVNTRRAIARRHVNVPSIIVRASPHSHSLPYRSQFLFTETRQA
ncbi:hypothetical protein X946_5506 [Burkholderia sp. ABCPW 111]|nr:hypothetical protein X946_5506 [Burkholderia sp. ABCPW 111]